MYIAKKAFVKNWPQKPGEIKIQARNQEFFRAGEVS